MCKYSDFEMLLLEKPEISCADFDELLGDYVDGELSEPLKEKFEAHREICAECQDGLELYTQVIDIAGQLGEDSPSVEMSDAVRERLYAKLNGTLGLKLE